MAQSDSIGALATALAAAQAEFPSLPKTKTVQVRTDKGTYSFRYAPLEEIIALVRPVLAKHGLAFTQTFAGPALCTTLMHSSGEWLSSFGVPLNLTTTVKGAAAGEMVQVPMKVQEIGSQITYLRRYALVSLLGVAAEDDDDGNAAQGNQATQVAKPAEDNGQASEAQVKKIRAKVAKLSAEGKLNAEEFAAGMAADYGVRWASELTPAEADEVIGLLAAKEKASA